MSERKSERWVVNTGCAEQITIGNANDAEDCVAICWNKTPGCPEPHDEAMPRARHIVKCVNHFDEMYEALRELVEVESPHGGPSCPYCGQPNDHEDGECAFSMARTILSKIEAGE